jgi:hypothetical protein
MRIDAANHRPTIAPIAFGAQTFLLDRSACGCALFGRQQARAYRLYLTRSVLTEKRIGCSRTLPDTANGPSGGKTKGTVQFCEKGKAG